MGGVGGVLRRQHESRLGEVELGGDRLHLLRGQAFGVGHDGQGIAAEFPVGEDVDGLEGAFHAPKSAMHALSSRRMTNARGGVKIPLARYASAFCYCGTMSRSVTTDFQNAVVLTMIVFVAGRPSSRRSTSPGEFEDLTDLFRCGDLSRVCADRGSPTFADIAGKSSRRTPTSRSRCGSRKPRTRSKSTVAVSIPGRPRASLISSCRGSLAGRFQRITGGSRMHEVSP